MASESNILRIKINLEETSNASCTYRIITTEVHPITQHCSVTGAKGTYKFMRNNVYQLDVILVTAGGEHRFIGTTENNYLWVRDCECIAKELVPFGGTSYCGDLTVKTQKSGKRSGGYGDPSLHTGVEWWMKLSINKPA